MTRIVAYPPGLCHPAEVPPAPRRTIVAWTLYDFANSAFAAIVLATIYPAFYANLVVGNATGHGDFLWGAAISTAMVIGALTSPLLGGIADHAGARKRFFIGFTVVCVATTALMATVRPGMVVWGWVLAVAGVVTYEAATVYYNSYLPRIARPEELGRVSAAGFAVGYAGSLVAFLAAYPFGAAVGHARLLVRREGDPGAVGGGHGARLLRPGQVAFLDRRDPRRDWARRRPGGKPHLHGDPRPARARGRVLRLLRARRQDGGGARAGGLRRRLLASLGKSARGDCRGRPLLRRRLPAAGPCRRRRPDYRASGGANAAPPDTPHRSPGAAALR